MHRPVEFTRFTGRWLIGGTRLRRCVLLGFRQALRPARCRTETARSANSASISRAIALVSRHTSREVDRVRRVGEIAVGIANGNFVFCQENVQPGVVIAQKRSDRTSGCLRVPQAAMSRARRRAGCTKCNDARFRRRTQIPFQPAGRPRCDTRNSVRLKMPRRPCRK